MSGISERRMPVIDAEPTGDGRWVLSMPDGQAVIAIDGADARRIVDRDACGASIRFSGPDPRTAPDDVSPGAMGAPGSEESQERSEASARDGDVSEAAGGRGSVLRGHPQVGQVEPGFHPEPRLHPISSHTAVVPAGRRAGVMDGPPGP